METGETPIIQIMALIQYITRIQFDCGAVKLLPSELDLLGMKKPLLVTDAGIRAAGILDKIVGLMGNYDFEVFDGTPENPDEEALRQCLDIYNKKQLDGVIALGGGSPIDLAKAVALLVSHGGKFSDYGVQTGGSEKIGKVLPHIAIPTAAGTGAEIGRACVMTTDDGRKTIAVNLNMVASAVICDPELTLGLPPKMTAATGMDALTHGIEVYVSNNYNPPAQAIALDCVRRASRNLVKAYKNGSDIEARKEMMMAALEGGLCLQKVLGALHAMSAPLGEFGIHHGTVNGILLPHVLRYNESHCGELYLDLKKAVGIDPDSRLDGWAEDLLKKLDLPTTLRELGIESKHIPELAEKSAKDHLSASNPRPMTPEDYKILLHQAMG